MQILPDKEPMLKDLELDWGGLGRRPTWIEDPDWDRESCHVAAFRRVFKSDGKKSVMFHISADQRYTLFLDGKRLGFGPERGDDNNWYFQTYRETLAKGTHRLVAVVWWNRYEDYLTHHSHIGHRPSLLVRGVGEEADALLTTGKAKWEVLGVGGVKFTTPGDTCVGGRTNIDAANFPRGAEAGADAAGAWKDVAKGRESCLRARANFPYNAGKRLRQGTLPPMYEKEIRAGKTRHCAVFGSADEMERAAFVKADNDPALAKAFQAMLAGKGAFKVPAKTKMRVLVDARNYVCAWPMLAVSGGKGASVRINWAESLFANACPQGGKFTQTEFFEKGGRSETEGKFFRGIGDSLVCDGSEGFAFEPFWWEAGRYIRIMIETGAEALAIDSFKLRETHYPHKYEAEFGCDEPRWDNVVKISKRALEMCSHESYMDCPYYEQFMYAGDTRLEALITYATTRDPRLPRKAVFLFDETRDTAGFTDCHTPAYNRCVIPGFSLWWVMMVSDNALWRDDAAFVKARMPGVRAVLDAFRACVNPDDGLLHAPPGWNFVDWVGGWENGWKDGVPPDGVSGANATANLQFALVLRAAAELEEMFGENELAARCRRNADALTKAAVKHFWDAKRNLFAETKARDCHTEHAQCMAVLGGSVPKGKTAALAKALLTAPDLDRCTIYFSHYLFEAYRVLGMTGEICKRMDLWFGHEDLGLCTTVESPEPTRSDCHAWGAHPMFHAYATLAGIRPAAPGFRAVEIKPQLGCLNEISAKMPHPAGGFVTLDIAKSPDGTLHGTASTPAGIPATLTFPGAKKALEWDGGEIKF